MADSYLQAAVPAAEPGDAPRAAHGRGEAEPEVDKARDLVRADRGEPLDECPARTRRAEHAKLLEVAVKGPRDENSASSGMSSAASRVKPPGGEPT